MSTLINFSEASKYLESRNISNITISEELNPSKERLQAIKDAMKRKAEMVSTSIEFYKKVTK